MPGEIPNIMTNNKNLLSYMRSCIIVSIMVIVYKSSHN